MKLLAIDLCRLTALFHATRSVGQTHLPRAVAALVNRYEFAGAPASIDDMAGERIEFRNGEFEGVGIETLEIYSDGLVITSRSDTDLIDNFFADLTTWMNDEIGLSMIKTHSIDRMYDSNIIVESEKEILRPLEAVLDIAQMVGDELNKTSGLEVVYEPFGWSMATDQTKNPSLKPVGFRVERRLGTEFSLNQYISTAPLRTKQHMAVLKKLESLV